MSQEPIAPLNQEPTPIAPLNQQTPSTEETIIKPISVEVQSLDDLQTDDTIIADVVAEEDFVRNNTPSHARIQPVVVSKLIDIFTRLRDEVGMVSGFLSGHRAYDDVFDVFDLVVLSNVCFFILFIILYILFYLN